MGKIDTISIRKCPQQNSVYIYIPTLVGELLKIDAGDSLIIKANPFRLIVADTITNCKSYKLTKHRCITYSPNYDVEEILGDWQYEVEDLTIYLKERAYPFY